MSLILNTGLWMSPAAVGGTPASYFGDAYSASTNTSHTFNEGSSNETALPSSYGAGTYLVGVTSITDLPSAVTVDGDSATSKQSHDGGTSCVSIWEVTVTGGGTTDIVVSLPSSQHCGIVVIKIDSETYSNGHAFQRQIGSTTFPVNDDGTTQVNTSSGDLVFAMATTVDASAGTWVGLTQIKAIQAVGTRYMAAGWKDGVAGGSPESLSITTSSTFQWVAVAMVVYN